MPTPPLRPLPSRGLVAAVVVLTLLPSSAAFADDRRLAEASAAWAADQLVDGQRATVTFDGVEYDDAGLTADVILALGATGSGAAVIAEASDWFEGGIDAYTGATDDAVAVGAVAKATILAVAVGRDPRDFGGRDLVADLVAREAPDGRFTDAGPFGDFSTPFTQALALIALERAGITPSAAAVARLAGSACADGGIPAAFDAAPCASDVDSTALAVDALVAVGGPSDAIDAAAGWLESELAGPDADGATSANSLGLAAVALVRAGDDGAAATLRARVAELAQGCDAPEPGAVRADVDGAGDALRATPQAVMGLTGVGYATIDATDAEPALRPIDCGVLSSSVRAELLLGAAALLALVLLGVRRRRAA